MKRLFRSHVWLVWSYRALVVLLGLTLGLSELSAFLAPALDSMRPDPVLLLVSERSAGAAGAILLLAAAGLAALPFNPEIRWGGVFLTGAILATYQLTRLLFGVTEPCRCLCTAAQLLGVDPAEVAVLKYLIIGVLMIPSAGILEWSRAKPIEGS